MPVAAQGSNGVFGMAVLLLTGVRGGGRLRSRKGAASFGVRGSGCTTGGSAPAAARVSYGDCGS
eukprot:8172220-Prorocentrum_lima.AAC.1